MEKGQKICKKNEIFLVPYINMCYNKILKNIRTSLCKGVLRLTERKTGAETAAEPSGGLPTARSEDAITEKEGTR